MDKTHRFRLAGIGKILKDLLDITENNIDEPDLFKVNRKIV